MDILKVTDKIKTDHSIVSYEFHSHQPFGSTTFDNNDEIRISIPEIDNYTLPSESYLYVEGSVRKLAADGSITKDASATGQLVNNPVAFMVSHIRYLINGVHVDGVRNVGISSCMKGYFSSTQNEVVKLENAGWHIKPWKDDTAGVSKALDKNGNFGLSVPLKTLLGFAEDFRKIMMNVRQELVLIRGHDDTDVIFQPAAAPNDEKLKLIINKIIWRVPHVAVGLREQLALTKLSERNVDIHVPFRSWEIHEYPQLPQTTKQSWSVKTAPQLETPRFIIIGFQTNRKGIFKGNMALFDNINLTNVTVFLNGERFPYDNLNMDFDNNHYAILYDMYSRFQQAYYYQESEPLFSPEEFKTYAPLIGIDCTYQQEAIHKSGVEIKIEYSTKNPIPEGTTAYALILHDRAFVYSPLTKMVKQLI
ncbi:uncharacterized protein [Onthophagus taurus]|uniref:uncharacterized protein n=1 Tax=Onthophagus taurus TaxID=166361 RepID=UPI0039BE13A3